ncbi:MAG: methyltransferase domain-containing protein [Burkholderiales bacterium]
MDRRLHIGGAVRAAGWEVLNANAGPHVDHVCNANDLSRFPDDTFVEIYASHVVEHFDYTRELQDTLTEWCRVLRPGGRVSISVPDMEILAEMFVLKEKYTPDDRFMIMRMLFGGHVDQYDYHVVGLNEEFLSMYLSASGFCNLKRVDFFGLFNDTSSLMFKGVPISLNMTAEKPRGAG